MPHKWKILSPSFFSFLMVYLSSFFIVLSCKDWLIMWMGLEINMISFLMIIYNKYSVICIESCLKYFMIQAIGSMVLLLFIYMNIYYMDYIGSSILCYKIGGGPFYFWFTYLCENLSWWSCFFLMIFQKIIPMMLMSFFISFWIWMLSMFSLVIGVMGSMNQLSLKRLFAFSSVHHIGWMMISMLFSDVFWLFYLFMYMLMMISLINYFMYTNMISFFNMYMYKKKWLFFFCMLNMGGVPPFLGFFLKWWSFYFFMIFDYTLMMMLFIFSVIMLYIYFRVFYDFILGNSLKFEIYFDKMMYMHYFDILILLGFCLGCYMGMYFFM